MAFPLYIMIKKIETVTNRTDNRNLNIYIYSTLQISNMNTTTSLSRQLPNKGQRSQPSIRQTSLQSSCRTDRAVQSRSEENRERQDERKSAAEREILKVLWRDRQPVELGKALQGMCSTANCNKSATCNENFAVRYVVPARTME
jgi:hypothetical protein